MAVQRHLSSGQLTHSFDSLDHSPEGLALGEFLRQAREARGITLQEISRTTKIPSRHLDALEHGDLAAIPSGPYRRGEIKAYAKVVGLDANVALARLDRAEQVPAPPSRNAPAGAARRIASPRRTLQRVGAVGGIAIASALGLIVLSRDASDGVTAPPVAHAPVTASTADSRAPAVEAV